MHKADDGLRGAQRWMGFNCTLFAPYFSRLSTRSPAGILHSVFAYPAKSGKKGGERGVRVFTENMNENRPL
jgi:hypothetical protein